MARSLRDIRRKIKAVKSTRQVTKAMELVAASKMRRAVSNAQMLREYAVSAFDILERIADVSPNLHPFLSERPLKNVLVVLITSDRGLCGSLNAQVFRAAERYLDQPIPKDGRTDFVAVGRKGQQFLARAQKNVIAAFPAFSNHPQFRDVLPLAKLVSEGYLTEQYDHIVLIYAGFVSALVQEIDVKVLLPFSEGDFKRFVSALVERKRKTLAEGTQKKKVQEFLFEPTAKEVVNAIVPQLTEVQMYQAILEAAASEHSARMVAMRNASDNASDILDGLTLTYNQTRQANITAELSELSASKAALES